MIVFCAGAGLVFTGLIGVPRYVAWKNLHFTYKDQVAEERAKDLDRLEKVSTSPFSDLRETDREAGKAVMAVLVYEKENPREFRVRVIERGALKIFEIWHISAFEVLRKAAAQGHTILGNPGGNCRNIVYDSKTGKASSSEFWQ